MDLNLSPSFEPQQVSIVLRDYPTPLLNAGPTTAHGLLVRRRWLVPAPPAAVLSLFSCPRLSVTLSQHRHMNGRLHHVSAPSQAYHPSLRPPLSRSLVLLLSLSRSLAFALALSFSPASLSSTSPALPLLSFPGLDGANAAEPRSANAACGPGGAWPDGPAAGHDPNQGTSRLHLVPEAIPLLITNQAILDRTFCASHHLDDPVPLWPVRRSITTCGWKAMIWRLRGAHASSRYLHRSALVVSTARESLPYLVPCPS